MSLTGGEPWHLSCCLPRSASLSWLGQGCAVLRLRLPSEGLDVGCRLALRSMELKGEAFLALPLPYALSLAAEGSGARLCAGNAVS